MVKTKSLAEAVLAARCAKLWTQEECGRAAGVSSQLISNIERGEVETITRLTASKLQKALDVNLSQYVSKRNP